MNHPLCRHCGKKIAKRPGGLCWTCYYAPGIRAMYPTRRRNQYVSFEMPIPLCKDGFDYAPTGCPAGSEDKIEVMRERVAYGLPVCHPEDAGYRERILLPG